MAGAETDDLAEQMRCLKAIVALDPDLDWAQAALTRVCGTGGGGRARVGP